MKQRIDSYAARAADFHNYAARVLDGGQLPEHLCADVIVYVHRLNREAAQLKSALHTKIAEASEQVFGELTVVSKVRTGSIQRPDDLPDAAERMIAEHGKAAIAAQDRLAWLQTLLSRVDYIYEQAQQDFRHLCDLQR